MFFVLMMLKYIACYIFLDATWSELSKTVLGLKNYEVVIVFEYF